MASTYTTNAGIELIATGEQSGTWGDTTNTNLQIVDRLTNGVGAISLSGTTHTLTTSDGALSDGQYAVLVFGGTPSGTNTVTISPNTGEHLYFVKNNSGQSVILTQGSGGNVTIADGKSAIVYADGAGAGAAVVDVTSTFNFQPLDAELTAIAALSTTDGNFIVGNGSTWVAESGATARTSLGLGSIATQAANNVSITGGSITGITDLAVADGGTGASSFTANNVLLGNGTSSFQTVAPGTSGNVLTSNGSTWTSATPGATITGTTDSASPFETSLGTGAGAVNTGVNNTFIGFEAGNDNTTGTNNVAVGYQALDASTTGQYNVAMGSGALGANTTASGNVVIGRLAAASSTTASNNVAIGRNALFQNVTGSENVAVGAFSLSGTSSNSFIRNTAIGLYSGYSMSTGGSNFFGGFQAGYANSSGNNNVAIGRNALYANTTASDNVAVGYNALDANTTGFRNVAVGSESLTDNTAGYYNTAVGYQAAANNTTALGNSALGYQALFTNTTGTRNVAFGLEALYSNTTADDNVGLGYRALYTNTTGTDNVAVGAEALEKNTTGINNVAVGHQALEENTTGTDNVAVGYQAGDAISTGTQNTILGTGAASSGTNDLTTGSNNIVIGYNAAASSATVSNEITLGNTSVTKLRVPGVGFQFDTTDGLIVPKTVTAGGTTGAQTINKTAGTVNFAAAATSLVVTNSFVDANSIIIATVGTDDTTMKSVAVVAAAGSFTIHANAAATAETRVNWFVAN